MSREDERTVTALADGGDPARNLGQERHRILRQLRHEFERHPAVVSVRGVPDGRFRELQVELDPTVWDRDASSATLRVGWWPAPDDPEFVFHYSESTGLDCGWHREPNPHVDGKTHYQERTAPDDPYRYEAVTFPTSTPAHLCWIVMERLADRLSSLD